MSDQILNSTILSFQEVVRAGNCQVADSIAWEFSPPGSGPTPAYPDLTQDKAVVNGWRYPSPPAAFE